MYASIPLGGGFGKTGAGPGLSGPFGGGLGTAVPGPNPFGGAFGGPSGGDFTGGAASVFGGAGGGALSGAAGGGIDGSLTSGADPYPLLGLSDALLPWADVMRQPFSLFDASKNSLLLLMYSVRALLYSVFSLLVPR